MTGFGADEIRIAEVLNRSVAHLAVACELYGMGRKPDALLQAARPITDILPALETEVRSAGDELSGFFTATAAVGAEIRANSTPRSVRRAFKKAERAARELSKVVLTEVTQEGPGFDASVGIALLDPVPERYRRAVAEEDLGEYQTVYALVDRATDLIVSAYRGREHTLSEPVDTLRRSLPSAEPPEKLLRPEAVVTLIDTITTMAIEDLGAIRLTWTLADSARRLERLLGDVVDAYERELGPLAARLAASLFVRAYDPIRRDVAAAHPDTEARLTSLLGFELRTAINENAPENRIQELAAEARELLVTLRTHPVT